MIGVDFFCGVGGLTRGLLNAGVQVILGIDNDTTCQETYERNNAPARFLASDIRSLNPNTARNLIGDIDPHDLLFVACAPCQPFAQLNKSAQRDNDATLLGRFVKFIEEFRPHQVFIENVPGIAKVPGGSTFRRLKKKLSSWGYSFVEGVVDAKKYGVPQTRRRLVLIAMMGVEPSLPEPVYGPNLLPYITVRDSISHYPPITAGETHLEISNHKAAILSPINLTRIQNTPHDGGDHRVWPEELWLNCHRNGNREDFFDIYGRMSWDLPSPTLTCKCYSLSNGRYGHPEQDRAISFREAARLQTFNDDYIFYSTFNKVLGRHIGNAVPVRLAETIGRHILNLRENSS